MAIKTYDTIEEVRTLEGLLRDYIQFVCDDLQRNAGVSFDVNQLINGTLSALHKVVPPAGRTFVFEQDPGRPIGMVFLRRSGATDMEIKRLFVTPEARGTGAGRALVQAAIQEAKTNGRKLLKLDTTRNLTAAIRLYHDLGFEFCAPYPESDHFDDDVLGPHLVFMQLRLSGVSME